jgi:hypothetical protein
MSNAIERRYKEEKVTGAIELSRFDGASDEEIVEKLTKLFDVSREYVLALLAQKRE